jgi:LPPG:FO 2-phospho-L-lactate transferase
LKITALAGGVGASKFLTGLMQIVDQKDLSVIVNTGDDFRLYGLHISPDLDTITYTLAGIIDDERGWGIKNDTFHFLDSLRNFECRTWFNLGDKDLATHIYRTMRLNNGLNLTEVTNEICDSLEVSGKVLPMTDDEFPTMIKTGFGSIHFVEYLVKNGAEDDVLGVEFPGAEDAKPANGVVEAINDADLLIVCPSNPIVSIGTILKVPEVRDAIKKSKARKLAVSPIVGGAPIKGPADKLLRALNLEVSACSVAKLYKDFLDIFVLDTADANHKEKIEKLGMQVKVTNTVMKNVEDKVALARSVLE